MLQKYELLPHIDTQSLKTERIGFGKLAVQVVKSLGLVRPANQNNNKPIRKRRFLDHMENMVNWITFISTLPTRKLSTRNDDHTVPTEVIDWLIKEIFDPNDSLPVLGIAEQLRYPLNESAFADLQKILDLPINPEVVPKFKSSQLANFIYNMPEPGQGYQFKTKDQRMMKAICSFNLFYMGQNTKVPGLEGKRKAQNPIDVDEKTQIKKSWKNQYSH
ncbi:hypothetical protein MJO29_011238 [Puccinia striiformis f. sp. tritici]|nr:hypothetical protein MJO29_011238 [Puccinia striiformis f. sp. tritici]